MRVKFERGLDGSICGASVTLTERERTVVLARAVPLLYSPGGMGPDMPTRSRTVRFGGACCVGYETKLRSCLNKFRWCLKVEIARQDEARKLVEAQGRGFRDFPAGAAMDALCGKRPFPDKPRCPYRKPARAAAWDRGLNEARAAVMASGATP